MIGIHNSQVAQTAEVSEDALVLNSTVGEKCQIFNDALLCYSKLGDLTTLMRRSCVFSSIIGKYCSISWNVTIGPGTHDYNRISTHSMLFAKRYGMIDDNSERFYNQYEKDVIIGNDVWIGCNSVILRGVHIGDGAIIGANSVITKDVPPYAIVVGVNRVIKYRFEDEIIKELLKLKWWDYPIEIIKDCISYIASEPTVELIKKMKMEFDARKDMCDYRQSINN